MKKLTLFLLITSHLGFAQPKTGQTVPDVQFATLLNAPTQATTLDQLKGKIVLIDFWATWCGACVQAMPHLQQLQTRYPQQLQVITVTDETPTRIERFLKFRPSNLWFATDSARSLPRLFPHGTIPHTVLISADGKLIAQTSPEAVTDQVIDSLLNQQAVHLPEKVDNPLSVPEVMKTYFSAADTVQSRFMMQAEIKGSSGVSTTHRNDSVFKNRRITCLNLSLRTLYTIAYGNFSFKRTIDKTGSGDAAPVYCLDLIVPTQEELLPTLRKELASRFDVKATMEPQQRDVNVLTITDWGKFGRIPRNKSGKRTYSSGRGAIDQEFITMVDFADFLESYGPGRLLVVDETQNDEKLDIKFSYHPENPQSLTDRLNEMGLVLTKAQRKIDMLVLSN